MEPSIARFYDSDRRCGAAVRELVVGDRVLRLAGLSAAQATALGRFWGPYLAQSHGLPIHREIEVVDAGPGVLLGEPLAGELYRVEPRVTPRGLVTMSYAFALGALGDQGPWRIALASGVAEPEVQSLENATRILVARMAVELGGFALHSAGVVRDDRAFLFTGPSGAGKSTAVRLSAPALSLGDDFGVIVPAAGGWQTPPLPFDNAPEIVSRPDQPFYPVAGVWRLHQAAVHRVERPSLLVAATSLASCTALPWAMPDLADPLLEQIGRFCSEGRFAHLHFAPDAGFWQPLMDAVGG